LAQARREGRIKLVPYDPTLPVHTIWDLGIGPQLVCLFVQKASREVRIIDIWQGEGSDGLPEAAVMLQNRKYPYGKHYAPHDANKTETGSGKTIVQQAKGQGIAFERIPSIGVDDGINQALMKCELLVSALRNYRKKWDPVRLDWLPEPFKEWTNHFADALRYLSLTEDLMTNENEQPMPEQEDPNQDVFE
jgi:phage terminase large subunit